MIEDLLDKIFEEFGRKHPFIATIIAIVIILLLGLVITKC